MKLGSSRRVAGITAISAMALVLAACGGGDNGSDNGDNGDANGNGDENGVELSGSIAGAGASSQENAMVGWQAGFTETTGVDVSYDAVGSGSGREQFLSGAVLFAGSDAMYSQEELDEGVDRCFGGEVIELPLYISPIAVAYNLPDVDAENLQLDAPVLADIFNGEITNWNDEAIAETNPDVDLPDLEIIPVNRSDDSGTTENFTEYLAEAAPENWPHEPAGVWPIDGTQSGAQTQGLIDVVEGAEVTIGYADASRVGDLGTVAVGVGEEYVPFSPEAAAAVVSNSPDAETADEWRLTVDLARDTQESGNYPVVQIAYSTLCSVYDDEQDAANVAEFFRYVASEEGQQRAADPEVAGSAPISEEMREQVNEVLDQVSVN